MCGPAVVVAPVRPTNRMFAVLCVCVCVRATCVAPSHSHTSVPVLKYNTLLVLLKNVKTQLGLRGYEFARPVYPLTAQTEITESGVYICVKDNYTENPYRDTECVPLWEASGMLAPPPASFSASAFRLRASACRLPAAAPCAATGGGQQCCA